MKKLLPLLLLLLAASSLHAQDAQHRNGITFGVGQSGSDVSVRRIFGKQWAGLASLGYANGNVYPGVGPAVGDFDIWTVTAGARRYFGTEQLKPFAELSAGVQAISMPGNCSDTHSPYGRAGGGVEYSLAPRVSIEGSAGLAYSELSQRCTDSSGAVYRFDSHSLSTFRTALSITFYF